MTSVTEAGHKIPRLNMYSRKQAHRNVGFQRISGRSVRASDDTLDVFDLGFKVLSIENVGQIRPDYITISEGDVLANVEILLDEFRTIKNRYPSCSFRYGPEYSFGDPFKAVFSLTMFDNETDEDLMKVIIEPVLTGDAYNAIINGINEYARRRYL